jgi:hypothetical protein
MLNKRGQGLQISTIILIILGLAILVLLIVGFMTGWQKILPWISSNNVDTVVNQCQAACSTQDVYGFCTMERTLKAPDLPEGAKEVKSTCENFSTDVLYEKYNIEECPDLCPAPSA